MIQLFVNIDVDDLDKAITFYRDAFGLTLSRRFGEGFAELTGATSTIHLLKKPSGGAAQRTYARHWTPVHIDFTVADLDIAVARVQHAGGTLDRPIQAQKWGRMANMADPFGHGFCLLQFVGRGYDELAES